MSGLVSKSAHEKFMVLALTEARKGLGKTSPNPPVGAVLLRKGRVLSKAYHPKAGAPHAEKLALKKVSQTKGTTLYVTLEPCCHFPKKTPPCVPEIIAGGVRRVVVGCLDPNPKVAGRGVRALRRAGIEVITGVLQEECEELIRFFRHGFLSGRPYVLLKVAASLDGRVALANGKSQWITGEASRKQVHRLRAQMDAVLVGIGTVVQDDPRLNSRIGRGAKPLRVVLDPQLKISPRAKVLNPQWGEGRWVVTRAKFLESAKAKILGRAGVRLLACPWRAGRGFDLKFLLKALGAAGVHALMVEGGPRVWTHFWEQGLWQELQLYLAPKILGGDALPWIGPLKRRLVPDTGLGRLHHMENLGEDIGLNYRNLRGKSKK